MERELARSGDHDHLGDRKDDQVPAIRLPRRVARHRAPLHASAPALDAAPAQAFADAINAGIHAPGPRSLLRDAAAIDRPGSGGAVASCLGVGQARVFGGDATRAALAHLGARGAHVDGDAFIGDDDPHVRAHELAHVAQTRRPSVGGNAEADADRLADAALRGEAGAPDAGLDPRELAFYPDRVTRPAVNVRSAPQGGPIDRVNTGQTVDVVEDPGGPFVHVRYEHEGASREGWISRQFLEHASAAPPVAPTPAQPAHADAATAAPTRAHAGPDGGAAAPTIASASAPAHVAPIVAPPSTVAPPAVAAGAFDANAQPGEGLISGHFLGRSIHGHPILLRQLAAAEAHLQAHHGVAGADLQRLLGVSGGYSILRAGDAFHHYGLAIDINYEANPYVGGQSPAGEGHAHDVDSVAAIYRAAWLTGGEHAISSQDSSARGHVSGGTDALYEHFSSANGALVAYLGARTNLEQVQRWLDAGTTRRELPPPRGVRASSLGIERLRTADAAAWLQQIDADYTATHATHGSNWERSNNTQRRGLGFMDLNHDLVHALREVANLAWGASDFGGEANGDFMHFDARNFVPAHEVRQGVAAYRVLHPRPPRT